MHKIRILLADDHPLMRQAIRTWLEKQQDMEVIAEARDGKEAVEIATKLLPDIVILDISMPKLNGMEATKQIIEKCPGTEVLVVTVHADNEHLLGMIQAGASGYLTKEMPGEEIVHAVRTIFAGENVLPTILQDNIEDAFSNEVPSLSNKVNELTSRELTLLKLLAQGMPNKDIAVRLGLSLRNVKSILTVIFLKLGVSSRTEAISLSLKLGIITIKDLK